MTFSLEENVFGEVKPTDLIPNGRNIDATEANKGDYIEKFRKFKLETSIQSQMKAFKKGFYEVTPKNLMVQAFNAKELELMISGLPTIDCKNILKYYS